MVDKELETILDGVDDFAAVADRLESHNKWRRGDDSVGMGDPIILGKDLEIAVKACRMISKLKREYAAGKIATAERYVR